MKCRGKLMTTQEGSVGKREWLPEHAYVFFTSLENHQGFMCFSLISFSKLPLIKQYKHPIAFIQYQTMTALAKSVDVKDV